jgi:hypothetical protein
VGTIEGAAAGSTITVRVLVEERPAARGDKLNGVGGYCARVELDRVHQRAVDVGSNAEVEVGLRAGDGGAEIVVGGAFRRSGWFEILPAARHADDAIVDFAYTGNPLGYLFRFVA